MTFGKHTQGMSSSLGGTSSCIVSYDACRSWLVQIVTLQLMCCAHNNIFIKASMFYMVLPLLSH